MKLSLITCYTMLTFCFQRFYLREKFTPQSYMDYKPRGWICHRFLIGWVCHMVLFINKTIAHVAAPIVSWPERFISVSVYLSHELALDLVKLWWMWLHSLDFQQCEEGCTERKDIFIIPCLSQVAMTTPRSETLYLPSLIIRPVVAVCENFID